MVLEDYVLFYDKEKKTLESVRKNILNAFLKILRLENIKNDHGRVYTKRKLIHFLKSLEDDEYDRFKLNLYQWSLGCIKGKASNVISQMRDYIPVFLSIYEKEISTSSEFVQGPSEITEAALPVVSKDNIFEMNDITVEVGTVHSAKGQTHTATLYLETYFYKDGKGANAKSYESQRLADQILGNPLKDNVGKRVKQSAKMAYVGFSRPTHFLCFAVHKDRFDSTLERVDKEVWDIVEVKKPTD